MDPKNKLHREIGRLILSLILLCVVFYFTSVSMAFADNRGISAQNAGTMAGSLEDLGHDILIWLFGKDWNVNDSSNDIVLGVLMVSTFFYVILTQKDRRIRILTRWALTISTIFFLRDILVFCTVFPWAKEYRSHSNHDCKHWDNVFAAPYYMIFEHRRTCYDTFFSGHTTNATVCCMILTTFTVANKLLSYIIISIGWCLNFLTIIFILHLQVHYSIDVEIGLIFGIIFFLIIDYQIQLNIGWFSWWEEECCHYSLNTIMNIKEDHRRQSKNNFANPFWNRNNNNNNNNNTINKETNSFNPFYPYCKNAHDESRSSEHVHVDIENSHDGSHNHKKGHIEL